MSLAVLVALMFSKYVYLASLNSYYTFYLISKFHVSVQDRAAAPVPVPGRGRGGHDHRRADRRPDRTQVCDLGSILGVLPFTLLLPHANLFWTGVLSVVSD